MEYKLKKRSEKFDKNAIEKISNDLNIGKKFAEVLFARGIDTTEKAYNFLNPSLERLNSPFLFKDMGRAVEIIKSHVSKNHKICIYGDYDVDGISGSAILYKTLKRLNANIECVLPSRDKHGYGLSIEAVEELRDFQLLITVDCGISNVKEVKRAKELGLDVIITDHHDCPDVLPNADCIINPKVSGEEYPFKYLCGAGVALKLSEALIGKEALKFLDIASLATIADMVPLIDENRIIAKFGIERINNLPDMGLKSLIECVVTGNKLVDSQIIAYLLAPRINAAGRIAKADIAFDLLITEDKQNSTSLAKKLCKLNDERQRRQEKVLKEALAMEEKNPSDKIIIHGSKDWDTGIIGLGASKLTEQFNKPVILFGKTGEYWTGSARSISGVNIMDVLKTNHDLYEKFGGHERAAGLTVRGEYIEQIRVDSNRFLNENFDGHMFEPIKHYDIELKLKDITPDLIKEFNRLEPYGFDNKPVTVLFRDVNIKNIKSIGNDKHSKFTSAKDGFSADTIIFRVPTDEIPTKADIIGTIEISDYTKKPQIIAETLSYPPTPAQLYKKATLHLKSKALCETPELFYLPRVQMGEIYSLLKIISDNNYTFNNENELIKYIKNKISWITENNLAFAIETFIELNLIEYVKNDKITIKATGKKSNLNDSKIYMLYKRSIEK